MRDWTLSYEGFDPAQEGLRETLCALGNGVFCTRGAAEWADADEAIHYPGTYAAALYNRRTTQIADRPVENEDLVNLPNWLCLTFRIEGGPWFGLDATEVLSYRQDLDVQSGVLRRHIRFKDEKGRETSVFLRRLVSMHTPHLAAQELSLTAHGWSGRMEVRSALDGRVVNYGVKRYRQLEHHHLLPVEASKASDDTVVLVVQTNQSRIFVGEAARTRVYSADGEELPIDRQTTEEDGYVAQELAFEIRAEQPVRVEKVVALFTTRTRGSAEPGIDAGAAAMRAEGFSELLRAHESAWGRIWRRCDLEFEQDEHVQLILRVHIFHLLQTTSPHTGDLDAGAPARGLHGEAYRGHVFWDELYIFPFLNFRMPEITRGLLMYRYRRLDEARAAAKAEGYQGAMYPWQSGANGREETQTMHLNPKSGRWLPDKSHHQRHVNLAIAYNVIQYVRASGDHTFLSHYGMEMLLEIARFWASIAHLNADSDRYEIHGVMGPDEYHENYPGSDEPGLRNNAYTNVMVAWMMRSILQALDGLHEERRRELEEMLGITDDEISVWADMSRKMRVAFQGDGIISQFEGYDELEELDWDAYRKKYDNIQRMDRILEAEGDSANAYKLSKQADLVMLFYLFSEDELGDIFEALGYSFDEHTVARNVDYYEKRTSHGSTLSNLVFAAVTARFDPQRSWDIFLEALDSDVTDIQGGTTKEGVHLGVMAGTVDLLQRGYTGLEVRKGGLHFDPVLTGRLDGLRQRLRFRGTWLDLRLQKDALILEPWPVGDDVEVSVRDETYDLKPGWSRRVDL